MESCWSTDLINLIFSLEFEIVINESLKTKSNGIFIESFATK